MVRPKLAAPGSWEARNSAAASSAVLAFRGRVARMAGVFIRAKERAAFSAVRSPRVMFSGSSVSW